MKSRSAAPGEDTFARCETAIRGGRASDARGWLEERVERPLTRPERLRAAGLSFRVGLPSLGIRLLHLYVRPPATRPATATDDEKAVYAQCLTSLGATDEALRLLDEIPASHARAAFFRALAHVSRWEYPESVPWLEHYLASEKLSPYARKVAELNLAAAKIYEGKFLPARGLLRRILHDTSVTRWPLLHGNALELSCQYFFAHRDWDNAERFLKDAETFLKDTGTLDRFYVDKWRGLIAFLRDGDDGALGALREKARLYGHFETVRECDRFEALRNKDASLLARVYHGTPHEAYRRQLRRESGESFGATYRWNLQGDDAAPALDVGAKSTLSKLLRGLFSALAQDFYAPVRTATLGYRLYPDEHFNPETTPARVHEAVRRARAWLDESGLPLTVEESGGAYRLAATAPVALILSTEPKSEAERLRSRFGTEPFSVSAAEECLGMARRSIQRLLESLERDGVVARSGKGPATRYRLKK